MTISTPGVPERSAAYRGRRGKAKGVPDNRLRGRGEATARVISCSDTQKMTISTPGVPERSAALRGVPRRTRAL
eukprot:scaffold31431_cov78-Phaeocystis_antarctica.AAC.1